ncbi:MAG TPA: hypothetical protein VJS67_09830 [Pseudonocardiaceae bacterium]|nr:hypothetical protein [Pseudonocardiaceae bacterium]
MRVNDRGWVDFGVATLDGDVPALPVDLVVGGAQQAARRHARHPAVDPVLGVVGLAPSG